ncbi:MAG: hypothetical protein LC104_21090 [Bacteroidales bacterium]|nr:hypothetical protein [Bacteroidales bacterium]
MSPSERLLDTMAPIPTDSRWELAAESIAVKIRWFGLFVGLLIANFGTAADPRPLNAILLLGFGFTAVDTWLFSRSRLFLRDFPLLISAMEALFIGLLCHYEQGPDSAFRFYYLLSLICTAIRYSPRTTFITCGLDCFSYACVFATATEASPPYLFPLMVVILGWVSWAAAAMARLLKRAGEELRELNAALRTHQAELESRIAERTRALEESQAQVLHQEKMAAFGLLAAGIAHEVGNPLTSISAIVQMLEARNLGEYAQGKLSIVTGQLARIQTILRELITFSRPASGVRTRVAVQDVVDEALGIAKYYKGGKNRDIVVRVAPGLPPLVGVRDQFVQILFNLTLNAIDATDKGGRITISAELAAGPGQRECTTTEDGPPRFVLCSRSGNSCAHCPAWVQLTVSDNGHGIDLNNHDRLFRPYFTTKKHGTGLGLFVIRRIVSDHGGRASVESEPGLGTIFHITLPAEPGPDSRCDKEHAGHAHPQEATT